MLFKLGTRVCCTESEHGGHGLTEDGEESDQICAGCGEECSFEELEEDD